MCLLLQKKGEGDSGCVVGAGSSYLMGGAAGLVLWLGYGGTWPVTHLSPQMRITWAVSHLRHRQGLPPTATICSMLKTWHDPCLFPLVPNRQRI